MNKSKIIKRKLRKLEIYILTKKNPNYFEIEINGNGISVRMPNKIEINNDDFK